jgi:hypothetical protein
MSGFPTILLKIEGIQEGVSESLLLHEKEILKMTKQGIREGLKNMDAKILSSVRAEVQKTMIRELKYFFRLGAGRTYVQRAVESAMKEILPGEGEA